MASMNNNKEFFELLAQSDTHSGSDVQQLVIPPRKKRFRRRLRNNPNARLEEHEPRCGCRPKTLILSVLSVILVCWLISLTWLAVVLYKEILRLNDDVLKVVAAHQGVPDALQECHSLSRELQKNQTVIMDRLAGFSILLGNFSVNMSDVRNALSAVELQLKNSPSLVNDPRLVKDLSESVAKFGSKIQDLETTASALKEQDTRLQVTLTGLSSNMSDLRVQVAGLTQAQDGVTTTELASQKSTLMGVIEQVAANVSKINDTLSNKLQWTADDEVKDHKAVEELEEMNQNITARLKTLEGLCMKATMAPLPVNPSSQAEFSVVPGKPPLANLYSPKNVAAGSENKRASSGPGPEPSPQP